MAQQINPSVDAVRVALGNTGSKTTIHKYLKELDDAADRPAPSISESLLDIVNRLAAQLQTEADSKIEEILTQSDEKNREHITAISELQNTVAALRNQVGQLEADLFQEQTSKSGVLELYQEEKLVRHAGDQQVINLKERLLENESYRASLEEKHRHSREALEHYRQSMKEQRDQDQRRHEHQVQQLQAEMRQLQQSLIVKQDEVTRLNQEGARLVTDLSHAQKSIYELKNHERETEQKVEKLHEALQRNALLELQISEKDVRIQELVTQVSDTLLQTNEVGKEAHRLELALAASNAALVAQEKAHEQIRKHWTQSVHRD